MAAVYHPHGSIGYVKDLLLKFLEILGGEKVSIDEDILANGYNIYFEDSNVGLRLGKEEVFRCESSADMIKELAKIQVKKRDSYLIDLGKRVIQEKRALAKTPKYDRHYNDRPERRQHGKYYHGHGQPRKDDERDST